MSFSSTLKDLPMKIADMLESTINEMADTVRRHAQAVVSVIEGQIQELDVAKADIVEMADKAQAERLQRLEAFLGLHRSYYDAENNSERIVVEGRLAALESQSRALRALADKILAGEPVLPLAPQLPVELAVNMAAIIDPPNVPTVNERAAAQDDSALDDENQQAAAVAKESENGTAEKGT